MPVANEPVRPEQPPRLRLPGFCGYAFYVRPTWLQSMEGDGTLERAVDLELLTPDYRLEVFAQPCLDNFAKDLASASSPIHAPPRLSTSACDGSWSEAARSMAAWSAAWVSSPPGACLVKHHVRDPRPGLNFARVLRRSV